MFRVQVERGSRNCHSDESFQGLQLYSKLRITLLFAKTEFTLTYFGLFRLKLEHLHFTPRLRLKLKLKFAQRTNHYFLTKLSILEDLVSTLFQTSVPAKTVKREAIKLTAKLLSFEFFFPPSKSEWEGERRRNSCNKVKKL